MESGNMQLYYYIGEGPEADELIADVERKRVDVNAARKALCDEYRADYLFGLDDRAEGLFFKEKQNRPYLKGEKCIDGGYGYCPKLNCKAGKELAGKLCNPTLPFSVSDYIIDRLKISRMTAGKHATSRTGMALYYSVAGITDGKILVIIPGDDAVACEGGGDPMPNVPKWLSEVKESEWLAAQEK